MRAARTMTDSKPDASTLVAFGISTVILASNFVAVRFSNMELAPFWGATLRFAAATLLLFGILAARRIPLPRGKTLLGAAIFGALTFGAMFGLMYWALQDAPAGLASVLFAMLPLITFVLAIAHRLERFRWHGLAGALIAAGGVAVIFQDSLQASVPALSIVAILVAVVFAAEGSVVIKWFPRGNPLAVNAVAMAVGTVVLAAVSLTVGETWAVPTQAATWAALAWLIPLGSIVGFVLMVVVIGRWTVSAAAYQGVLQPIVTVLVAAWLLGERLTPLFALGSLLVLAGVYVGALMRPKTASAAPAVPEAAPAVDESRPDE